MNTLATILGILSGWAVAAFGWIKWLHELREKRAERAAKQKAEAELREIHRRSAERCPYFSLFDGRFNMITAPSDELGQLDSLSPNSGSVLCFWCDEVDRSIKSGAAIHLLVENQGCTAYEIAVTLDAEPVKFLEVQTYESHVLNAIKYAYRPEHHGAEQTLEIQFLAEDGVRDRHRYVTKHGFRILKRIDPA